MLPVLCYDTAMFSNSSITISSVSVIICEIHPVNFKILRSFAVCRFRIVVFYISFYNRYIIRFQHRFIFVIFCNMSSKEK